jgi:hypothetical protein
MPDRPDPALAALERHARAALPILRGIHTELRRGNDARDRWAVTVYELLRSAKEGTDDR